MPLKPGGGSLRQHYRQGNVVVSPYVGSKSGPLPLNACDNVFIARVKR